MTTKEKIIAIIRQHRGAKNPILSPVIRDQLGNILTDAELRAAISEMVTYERALIGSSSEGFFWIVTEEDLKISTSYLSSRIKPMVDRLSALKFNYSVYTTAQGDLFPEDIHGSH